ncbi:MAG: M56 family metallopeptidase [Gemmatimonadales bacterium]|nr:M56 family metallopeptidase [Gemmatimonadales bacterium]
MVTLLNEWAGSWGPYFLLAVIQNSLFLALVFVILRVLRRAPARILSLVATLGVVKLAIPPFLPLGWLEWLDSKPADQVVNPISSLLFPFADLGTVEGSFTAGVTGGFTPVALLMMIWASVALTRLGIGLVQTIELAMNVQGAERIDDAEIPAEVRQSGLSVWRSERIYLPLTMGIRPRRIFVPLSWDDWPTSDRQAVLLHELAHVHRRDGLVQVLEIFAGALFFFLPPVTWLVKRLRMYREMACDDASVTSDPQARLNYSRFLCSLAESVLDMPQATASASTLARRQGELLDRVAYQVKEGVVKKVTKNQIVLVLAVLLFTALPLSMVYGGKPKPKKSPPPPTAQTEAGVKAVKDLPPPPPLSVRVAITGGKGLLVDGQAVTPKGFKKAVKNAVSKKGPKAIINIDGDGGISMKQLHSIQKDLRDMGMLKVIYSGELGEAIPLVLPPDEARKRLKTMPEEKVIRVKVDNKGVVQVRGKKTAGAHVSEQIRKLLAKDERRIVILHTDPDTKYGAFVQVLDSLKKAGADKIAIPDPGD